MIELYRGSLDSTVAAAGIGQRVYNLGEHLGFSTTEATRLGVAAREMAGLVPSDAEAVIRIDRVDQGVTQLVVCFVCAARTNEIKAVGRKVFDAVESDACSLCARQQLPNPGFEPDEHWIHDTQVLLAELTISELYSEMERKNAELRSLLDQLNERAAAERERNRELEEANRELDRLREQEYRLARFDTITGLPTRTLFEDRLNQMIASAERNQTRFAVFFIDLDHFKEINDTLGHAAGDETLRTVGKRMVVALRKSDTVARLGGDEFAVLQQQLDEAQEASIIASKLLTAIGQTVNIGAQRRHVGASIGIAIYPENGLSLEELIGNADAAMYRAKREGRNGYRFYTTET